MAARNDEPAAKRVKHTADAVARSSAYVPPATTFTWTLQNLTLASFTGAKPDDEWESPEFRACGVRWRLLIRPYSNADDDSSGSGSSSSSSGSSGSGSSGSAGKRERFAGAFIKLMEPDCTVTPAVCQLTWSGMGSKSMKPVTFCTKSTAVEDGNIVSYGDTEWLSHVRLARVLENGMLSFSVKLRAATFAEAPTVSVPAPSLAADMAAQLASGDGADVNFKFAADSDVKRVQAHSFVLATRSATLRPQLRGPLASAPPHNLTVPDAIAPPIFKRLLSFLYTDTLAFQSHEEAQHLLHAADYYDVPRLRAMADSKLREGLTPENAVSTLALANRGGFHDLRNAVLRFVAAHAGALMATPQWGELRAEQPELLDAMLHTLAHGEPPAVAVPAPMPPVQAAQPQ